MKRVILLFAAVLFASIGWSQTVTLKFKNGTTQQYNLSEIESIDFADGDNNNSGNDDAEVEITEANIVGVWEVVSYEYDNYGQTEDEEEGLKVGSKLYFLSDGTCHGDNDSDDYIWLLNGKKLTISWANAEWGIPAVLWITKLTANNMELYMNYGIVIVSLKFKRVS